ncbi:MAG: matrixin family metalloprotease [Candidatus Paceibacterota bacterium]
MMRRVFSVLVPILILGAALFAYRTQVRTFALQTYRQFSPCTVPIPYTIGSIDPRFGISTSTVRAAVEAATGIWEKAADRDLFVYSTSTGIRIDLVYDSRQETTATLRKLGVVVNDDLASYDAAKARYQSVIADYTAKKRTFDTAYAAYQHEATLYREEVNSWNARGGAPQTEFKRLEAQKASLEQQEKRIMTMQTAVNTAADNVNALVTLLNHLAKVLNISAANYNNVGKGQSSEFEEAVYESAPGRESITVYEFDGTARLRRVLAHEFGHALGLEHIEDTASIMYRLNQNANEIPTAADREALDAACRLPAQAGAR